MQRVLLIVLSFCTFFAAAQDTVLKLYRPFGDVVDQTPATVKKILPGECIEPSSLVVREDAWRCMAANNVLDPCFVKTIAKNTTVICPPSPWIGDSIQIQVTAMPDHNPQQSLDMSRHFPWAVELTNGDRCQAIEPKETIDSMPIRYRCNNHKVLIGNLQRCKPVWSMLEKTPEGLSNVEMSRAWF